MSHFKALLISSESGDASASEVNLNLESVSALKGIKVNLDGYQRIGEWNRVFAN